VNKVESVWKKVDIRGDDECWPWVGRWKAEDGYGRMDIDGVAGVYSNRAAYLAATPGSITLRQPASSNERGFVLHSCDNPGCCNPKHLFLGTHLENMRDKVAKGRTPNFKGPRAPRAKLSWEQVREMRSLAGSNLSAAELGNAFGISKPSALSVIRGHSYVE
jgi:hypothetical protein